MQSHRIAVLELIDNNFLIHEAWVESKHYNQSIIIIIVIIIITTVIIEILSWRVKFWMCIFDTKMDKYSQ